MSFDKAAYRWVVLISTLVTTAIGIMIFASAFSLIPLWVKDLGISRTQAGFLTGLWYFTGIFVTLPVGWLADRIPLRRLFLSLWALNLAGTALMAEASGFTMLCLGRVVLSAGMAGHFVASPKLLATWFEGRKEFGLVMGFYSMSMTAGVYASLMVLGRVGEQSGWRPAMLLMVGVVAVGFVMMLLVPSQSPHASKPGSLPRLRPLQLGLAAWVLAGAFGAYNIATEAYMTFTPDFLVQTGYGLAAASAILGIYAWVALSTKPFLSFFLSRKNAALYVVVGSLLFLVSVVLLIARVVPPAVSTGIFGFSMALSMPALYALPPLLFGAEKSGQVNGLCQFLYGLGFVLQPLVGLTVDKTGRYTAGYALIAGVGSFALFGALWLSRNNSLTPALTAAVPDSD
jgi:cyanate permease